MKTPWYSFLMVVLFSVFLSFGSVYGQSNWITAYYAGWMQSNTGNDNGWLPSDSVDYSAVTHIFHFALEPTSSGGNLDSLGNSIYHYNSQRLIQRAHAAGKKVLITIGGWATNTNFMNATSNTNRANFIRRIMNYVTQFGYDGVDIDWEPIEDTEVSRFQLFIQQLRDSMNARNPNLLLCAATAWQPQMWGNIHQYFDQINLMTYDLSGPWQDWVVWHNAPVYDGNFQFPCCPGVFVPSANRMIDEWHQAGVPLSKLGIGIDFYGYVWRGGSGTPTGGVTAPRQSWTTAPTVFANVPYYELHRVIRPAVYRWDDTAQAAYLSIDRTGASADSFVSFDNESTAVYKVRYIPTKGIGGMIIWELGGGYFSRFQFPSWTGRRDPLLQAVKNAVSQILNVPAGSRQLPVTLRLVRAYPNPFNGQTLIQFELPYAGAVLLEMYNTLGQRVDVLSPGTLQPGFYTVPWRPSVATGMYFCRLRVNGEITPAQKLLYVR